MARATTRRGKKSGPVKVNFKDVETRSTPAEGDYPFKVIESKRGESGNGNDQIEVVAEITRGENKGFKGYLYFPLSENSLWKLAAFMTAVGMDVPQDEVEVDPEDFMDKEFVGVLHHETYNGRKRAKLGDFDSLENYTGTLPGDEDDGKGKKKKKKDKDGGKDKADDKSSKKDKSKDEPEEKSSKKDKSKDKSDKGGKDKSSKGDDAKSDKKKDKGKKDKGKKKPEPIYDADDINDLSAKKLQKVIDEHDLDVDLDDYKTDRKKAGAVIDALEAKGLMKD